MTLLPVNGLRVNLGCGDRYAEGWVNVDLATMPHRVDATIDIRGELPFEPLSIAHVYAGHVFEHLTIDECKTLLRRLLSCVVYRGELMIVGPDCDVAQQMIDDGAGLAEMWGATMESLRYGAGRWSGDEHHWEWTSPKMRTLLDETGWVDVQELHISDVSLYWPVADRRPQWQRAVTGKRPG